jgi:hypothetical protein
MPKAVKPPAAPPKLTVVTSLEQLQKECERNLKIEFDYDGKKFQMEARRLTPAQDAKLAEILDLIVPPMIRGKQMEDDRPDVTNLEFIQKKNQAAIIARALALYWCVPVFGAEKPGLEKREEIVAFIQSKLNDQILNILYNAIRQGGVTIAELVNFT